MGLWDDFVVGDGDKSCTAVLVHDTKTGHHISHDAVSYWVTGCVLGLSGVIFKDTEEGIMLGKLIEKEYDPYIDEHLDKIALKHSSLDTIVKAIESKKDEWIYEGEMRIKRALNNLLHV